MDKQKVSVKMGLPYSEALVYMKALVEGMEAGRIVVESGEERVCLTPSEHIGIKVEAKVKKDKQKISFEFSWAEQGEADLTIGSEPQNFEESQDVQASPDVDELQGVKGAEASASAAATMAGDDAGKDVNAGQTDAPVGAAPSGEPVAAVDDGAEKPETADVGKTGETPAASASENKTTAPKKAKAAQKPAAKKKSAGKKKPAAQKKTAAK